MSIYLNVWTQILHESQRKIQLSQITLHFSITYFIFNSISEVTIHIFGSVSVIMFDEIFTLLL